MEGKRCPSDMTDDEWAILEPLIPPAKPGGRHRSANMREVVNGIFYVLRGGIPWRFLPKEFPPWKTVYLDEFKPIKVRYSNPFPMSQSPGVTTSMPSVKAQNSPLLPQWLP